MGNKGYSPSRQLYFTPFTSVYSYPSHCIHKNTFRKIHFDLLLYSNHKYRNNKSKLVNDLSISEIKCGKIGQFEVKKETCAGTSGQILISHHCLLNTMTQVSFHYQQWLIICIRNENAQRKRATLVASPSIPTQTTRELFCGRTEKGKLYTLQYVSW
jgi:hypothetical protein